MTTPTPLLDFPPKISIELVQGASGQSAGTDSVAATFAGTPVEGNLLVAAVLCKRGASPIASITTPSGWTLAGSVLSVSWSGGGATGAVAIFYKVAGASESSTVTVTVATASFETNILLAEFSGLTAATIDQFASNDETSGTGLIAETGTTSATMEANELAVALCNIMDDDFDAPATGSWSEGYTQIGAEINSGSAGSTSALAYKILSATGAQNTTCTFTTGGAEERASVIATFKAA